MLLRRAHRDLVAADDVVAAGCQVWTHNQPLPPQTSHELSFRFRCGRARPHPARGEFSVQLGCTFAGGAVQLGAVVATLTGLGVARLEHFQRVLMFEHIHSLAGTPPVAVEVDLRAILAHRGGGDVVAVISIRGQAVANREPRPRGGERPEVSVKPISSMNSRAIAPRSASGWVIADLGAARHWYERAADAGHTDAMNNLGILLATQLEPPELPLMTTHRASLILVSSSGYSRR